jgi:hypothetical protein
MTSAKRRKQQRWQLALPSWMPSQPGELGDDLHRRGRRGAAVQLVCRTGDGGRGSSVEPKTGPGAGASNSAAGASAVLWRGLRSRASGGHGEEGGSWTLERGAEAAGGGARTATLAATELFLTIIRPRTVGSDLREARTAAPSAAPEGGVTREAAVASMGELSGSYRSGSTAAPADRAFTFCTEGLVECVEGRPDLVSVAGGDDGRGRSGGRRR